MSKILIEKIAMRAEQKRYIAKKFGVIPEGGWKSVIRDLRDDKGRALSREQGEKAILKHRYLTQDEWDKKVRAHNVNNTHEYGGVIDKKSGKFLQDKLVKGERHSVTTPWDSNDRQRTSSKMDFHLHGNESERFSRHYMAKKISNSNAERYEIARKSGAITKPEGWERKRHIAEIEWDRRHSGGHRMTGLSGQGGSYLQNKRQYRDELNSLFKKTNDAYRDTIPLAQKGDYTGAAMKGTSAAIHHEKYLQRRNLGDYINEDGKIVNDYRGDIDTTLSKHRGRYITKNGERQFVVNHAPGYIGKSAIGHRGSNTMAVHSQRILGTKKNDLANQSAGGAIQATSKFFDMNGSKKHEDDARKFSEMLQRKYKEKGL